MLTNGRFLDHMKRQWKLLVLRGVLAIGLAVVAFTRPGVTLLVLATLWGIYALADGIVALITALQVRDEGRPVWPLILIGLLGVAAGGFTLVRPGVTALAILIWIAAWAIGVGVLQVVLAFRLRREISGEWLLALSGVLSVIFGVVTIGNPEWGATVVVYTIGVYAFFFGLLLIALGLRLRGLNNRVAERLA